MVQLNAVSEGNLSTGVEAKEQMHQYRLKDVRSHDSYPEAQFPGGTGLY